MDRVDPLTAAAPDASRDAADAGEVKHLERDLPENFVLLIALRAIRCRVAPGLPGMTRRNLFPTGPENTREVPWSGFDQPHDLVRSYESTPPRVEADVDLAADLSPRVMHVPMEDPLSLVGRTLRGIAQLMG